MRILFIDNSPGMGGSVHHLAHQIMQVRKRGFEAFLIASKPHLFEDLIPDDVPCRSLAWPGFADVFKSAGALYKPVLPGIFNKPFSMAAYNRLKSAMAPEFGGILRSFTPDIVHINNFNLPNKVFGDVAKNKRIPVLLAALMIRLFSKKEADFAVQSDLVVCISEAVAECIGKFPEMDKSKLRVLESPIDASLYEVKRDPKIREDLGIPHDARLVLSLGRLTPWKGHDVLVRALGLLPKNIWLLQAGGEDDDWRGQIDGIVSECGLGDRVVYAGIRRDVPALLAASDIMVHSSKYAYPKVGVVEAFGRVVAEGMAAGLPVVATDAGGPAEILRDTGAGLLVPPGDRRAMAKAIAYYLENPEAARQAGEKGRRAVKEKYAGEPLGEKLMKIYGELR